MNSETTKPIEEKRRRSSSVKKTDNKTPSPTKFSARTAENNNVEGTMHV